LGEPRLLAIQASEQLCPTRATPSPLPRARAGWSPRIRGPATPICSSRPAVACRLSPVPPGSGCAGTQVARVPLPRFLAEWLRADGDGESAVAELPRTRSRLRHGSERC
jgi:hypothetical protein